MADQSEWLNSLFVRKDVDLLNNNGDENANGKYSNIKAPECLE